MQSDYEFSSKDGGKTWTRKCFGIEQLIGVMASKTPGFGALTGGYVVSFPKPVSVSALRAPLEAAWIRARATAPVLAYKTKDAKNDDSSIPEHSLYFEYIVPDDEAAKAWAKETIFWHEDKMTLRERDIAMKNVWWRAHDGKYNYELHVAPDVEENKWQILINAAHWSGDVRGTLQLSELVFKNLNESLVLHPEREPSPAIKWGEETKKLTPPAAIVAALVAGLPVESLFPKRQESASAFASEADSQSEDTTGPKQNGHAVRANGTEEKPKEEQQQQQQEDAAPPPPAGPVLFLRPAPLLEAQPTHEAVATDVWLTQEETARFRAVCKRHGITVTQALTALMCAAEVEWALTHREGRSEEEEKQIVEAYENATHIPSFWNVVDQRHKMKDYARHDSPKGSVPVGAEGFPLMIDMAQLRQAVKYNKETGKIERDARPAVFWETVARHCQELWRSSDMDFPAFIERDMMCTAYSTMYDPSAYMVPALMASSVGDIEQIGLLRDFSPSIPAASSDSERLLLEQVSLSVRCPTPTKMVLSWQWNGRLLVRPQTAARWTSPEGLDKMGEILRGWIEDVSCSST